MGLNWKPVSDDPVVMREGSGITATKATSLEDLLAKVSIDLCDQQAATREKPIHGLFTTSYVWYKVFYIKGVEKERENALAFLLSSE